MPTTKTAINAALELQRAGKHDEAVTTLLRAAELDPLSAETQNSLGNALKMAGQIDLAIASFRKAMALSPTSSGILANLGAALHVRGDRDEAIAAYRQAIDLAPGFFQVWYNLGNVFKEQGRADQAIEAYRKAIALQSDFFEAHYNLGGIFSARGEWNAAIGAFSKAVLLGRNSANAQISLANAYQRAGRLDPAIAAYRAAIALDPGIAVAHCDLGAALIQQGNVIEAIALCRHAVELDPALPQAHYNLAIALAQNGDIDQAQIACRQAIALAPAMAEAHHQLGNELKDAGLLDEAIAAYREAISQRPGYVEGHNNLIYALYFHPATTAVALAGEHRAWARRHAAPLKSKIQPHENDRTPDRRLRIGYVSPDFRAHPVGMFLLPLLIHHDHSQFEIVAYSSLPRSSVHRVTESIHAQVDIWREVADYDDAELADLIRQDRVDILIDLTLHMAHSRLLTFAQKPAPVQVTYLSYAGTSGLEQMDYRISDPYLDPVGGDESVYQEQTIRLPETYWCYRPPMDRPILPPPALSNNCVTFGSLNNFCKVNEPLLDIWGKIMDAVPKSRLIIHAREGSHRRRVLNYLKERGIESARIAFAGWQSTDNYLEVYQSIDIALDTFPYGGGTTTCDALWMGVPVVTFAGERAVGRGGLSILSNIGLAELVGKTPDDYVKLAVQLANDLPRLTALRRTIRQRLLASPLMDGPRFARNMEAACRQMWRNWCDANAR